MFKETTLLILGAGSSAEFGLPTGRGIFDHLSESSITSSNYDTFGRQFTDYYRRRIGDISELDQLLRLGQKGYHQSIDLLATRNPSLISKAKLLSAWCLISKMYHAEKEPYSVNSDYRRIVPKYNWRNSNVNNHPNWVGAIVGKFLQAGTNEESLKRNNLSVISFNYDTLFYDAFRHFLRQDEIYQNITADIIPEVIQVFGSFGNLKDEIHEPDIGYLSEKITFMDEKNIELELTLQRTKEMTSKADKIILLGFDCHEKNVDLIGLHDTNADIYAINYDGNETLNVKLRETLNIPEAHVFQGSQSAPVGLSEAFARGFLAFPDRFSSKGAYEKRGLRSL